MRLGIKYLIDSRELLQGLVLLGETGYQISNRVQRVLLLSLTSSSIATLVDQISECAEDKKRCEEKTTLRRILQITEPLMQAIASLLLYRIHMSTSIMGETDAHQNDQQQMDLALKLFDLIILAQAILNKTDRSYPLSGMISVISLGVFGKTSQTMKNTCHQALGLLSTLQGVLKTPLIETIGHGLGFN
jgi:hypothetical protein